MLKTVGIVGSGNVAWHLAHGLFRTKTIDLRWIWARNKEKRNKLTDVLKILSFSEFPQEKVDLVIICVSDSAIQEIVDQIPHSQTLVYTAGAVSMNEIAWKHENFGVFYPLQTFTKTQNVDLTKIPILIEANNKNTENKLLTFAQKLSNSTFLINSEQRQQIHIAAVFANNFVNHLIFIAQQHLQKNNISIEILQPLLEKTIENAIKIGAENAQTGPARRNDTKTIEKHINTIQETLKKDIYSLLTKSINSTYSSK